jgi:hypothetical protein
MIDICEYHWIWYLIGFSFCPQLTVMMCLQRYFTAVIPPQLMIVCWIITIFSIFNSKK